MLESKRNLIYVPELSANTFLFYYYEGTRDSRSYSVRDYSEPGLVRVRYAREFPYTAGQIIDLSARSGNHCFRAPKHRTDDLSFWHKEILAQNEQWLNGAAHPQPTTQSAVNLTSPIPLFPILNVEQLLRHPKAKKRGDLQRIFTSANSEDYVTWNIFQFLKARPAEEWWPELIALAERTVPGTAAELDANDLPKIQLWNSVAAPREYERTSRERMRQSSNREIVERSKLSDPVEGASEIDVTLQGQKYVIYIEAKLNSDISTGTTHDPQRDQVSRNIDCLMENCGERQPFFWMVVRDSGPGWLYTQTIDSLRNNPHKFLPHRSRQQAGRILKNLSVLLWRDVLEIATRNSADDALLASVKRELHSRLGLPPADGHSNSQRGEDKTLLTGTFPPPAALRKCACGCGLPVVKHAYVWGHKSGSRNDTVPMTAKDVRVGGVVEVEKTSAHIAIAEMQQQINFFRDKIATLEEAIKVLRN